MAMTQASLCKTSLEGKVKVIYQVIHKSHWIVESRPIVSYC